MQEIQREVLFNIIYNKSPTAEFKILLCGAMSQIWDQVLEIMNAEKRILVVDDDTDLLNALELLLPYSGYKVMTSETAETIFTQIEEFKPNLILLDIHIGPVDGRQICRAIKSAKETSALPVIMLSADETIYNTIQSVGANDVISKPFNYNNLTDRIDRQIQQTFRS